MNVELLHTNAKTPTRATSGSAGFDLYAPCSGSAAPGQLAEIHLGLSVAIPEGHVGILECRSSLARRHSLVRLGGVIDSDYRGELVLLLLNQGRETWSWQAGDRVGQLVVMRIYEGDCERVMFLDETSRGAGGFSSTGAA